MRYLWLLPLLLLVCVACAGGSVESATITRFNGMWTDEVGNRSVFDLDQKRVTMPGSEVSYTLTRVEGDTVYLDGSNWDKVTVRLIGDNTAEWRTETTGPFFLTKVVAP